MYDVTSAQEINDIVHGQTAMPVIEFPVELTPGQPKYYLSCIVAGSTPVGNGFIWTLMRRRTHPAVAAPGDVWRQAVEADAEYHLIAVDYVDAESK